MARHLIGLFTAAAIGAVAGPAPPIAQAVNADAAFTSFWSAESPKEAARLIDAILQTRLSFDDVYARLRQGRPYGPQKTGLIRLSNRTEDGVEHHFALNVPAAYDPARKYQARFQLHGGVMMRQTNAPPASGGAIGALEGAEQIYIVPFSWQDAPWWGDDQLLNLRAVLDTAKRSYNIDENRVVVSGVSDGGTGAYYVAMRDTTPFASFLPLNGFIMVLANPELGIDSPLYPNNIRNKPLFAVNGGRDPLYPTARVDPYMDHFERNGVVVEYHPQASAGHNTAWWPQVKDQFEAFARDHARHPLPDTLTWETSDPSAHNRAHWLVIDALGAARGEAQPLPDLNEMTGPPEPDFGARSVGTRINRVMPGSNAERIGLKAGDALVRLNGETVHVGVDIAEALEDIKPGSEITLLVARSNEPFELSGRYEPQVVTPLPRQLFGRASPSGRVDLVRSDNTVTASTRGVSAFTLLLSPDQFDFGRPVRVVANGRTVFDRKVEKSLPTLLKWAAADNDRTMLFGAEIHVDLAR
jgi:dienelactone hydrolase